ncbi:MAG TPA: histidine phosphatase family protein [Cytophagaceae bacterium]|jgi:broad specificity phosphatase PhoE|nr:histidine phosphatase family protein [Cytophagaceae bacterium]
MDRHFNSIKLEEKKIYLVRHGQTDYNLKGYVQGSGVDSDINQTGKKQADKFFEHYKNIPFKKVYTSKLKRSIQSVQSFIDKGIPHESYEELNEINWGNKDGKEVSFGDNTYYWGMVKKWREGDLGFKPDGGESPRDLQEKQKKVMNIILAQKDEDIILICMHGRAMRILLSTLLRQDLRNMDSFHHENLGLYILTYNGNDFVIEKSNDNKHLL